jgi:manganese oxidase
MTMGNESMAEHGLHIDSGHLQAPPNSIPMRGGLGPFGSITMGGLLTVLKVRKHLDRYDRDPGWYRHPEGTVAGLADDEELRRDGITT